MTVQDILGIKGNVVYGIDSQATLAEAARTLVEHKVGALLVFGPGEGAERELAGIITERDILYSCAADNLPLASTRVTEIMTAELITGLPSDPVESVMGLMTSRRIRHLPILAEGKLLGIVSIGDIVKAQHSRLVMENKFMQDYVHGVGPR